uniref:Uncharacterized protein n=1 Tax=Glossina austeni TaxID=7395 RepID=A0A1A9UUD2_GLOAU
MGGRLHRALLPVLAAISTLIVCCGIAGCVGLVNVSKEKAAITPNEDTTTNKANMVMRLNLVDEQFNEEQTRSELHCTLMERGDVTENSGSNLTRSLAISARMHVHDVFCCLCECGRVYMRHIVFTISHLTITKTKGIIRKMLIKVAID